LTSADINHIKRFGGIYTRQTFLYRTLNKSLKDSDYNVLFALRFVIADLHKQLAGEHKKFRRSHNSDDPIFRVYRGQAIPIDELNLIRNSIGEFLSIQSFLSTSTDPEVAISFAKQVMPTSELTRILKKETNGGVFSLGYLLYRQGNYEQTKKYFEQLLGESSISDFDKAHCYHGLGGVAVALKQYDEALVYYQKELELWMKMYRSGQHITIAQTYMGFGQVYCFNQELDSALECEQKALSLLPDNHIDRGKAY
ncbi:unnamed protein product, partial [Didymodactylos carnosus]